MSSVPRPQTERPPRYAAESHQKSTGATYTPAQLADFVADQILAAVEQQKGPPIRILDPAVGDGALLAAVVAKLPDSARKKARVVGFDTDEKALSAASHRLAKLLERDQIELSRTDFISHVAAMGDDLLTPRAAEQFDIVIANPPYVRTQIMGSVEAQRLAKSFGLTGRVDLYYPFLLGIARVLAPDGVAGIITSNRFMTTKSGQAVRKAVLSSFNVTHAWDLGDTKMFEAAVLPAVLIATGKARKSNGEALFTSVYETTEDASVAVSDAASTLTLANNTVASIEDGRRFLITSGWLDNGGDPEGVWRVATEASDGWLATVSKHTWATFSRIGKIRVGVKSTADKVFIRSDWDSLPQGRPELLRPLVTRHHARQFRSLMPEHPRHRKEILYPHEVDSNGRRRPVELARYPIAQRYLEEHRERLEARSYVIDAGRAWYEIWVPHDPAAWGRPKIVFPDISDKPMFWMELGGGVVNGECYWLQAENQNEDDLLWLALSVANSSFALKYYDHSFNNKLYAGRRRFITQYVEKFPLPDPQLEASKEIISLAKRIYELTPSTAATEVKVELERLVAKSFGLDVEEIAG